MLLNANVLYKSNTVRRVISRRRLQICQEVIKGLALCHLNEQPNHRIPVPPRRLTAKTTLLQLAGTESIRNEIAKNIYVRQRCDNT